ncbi:Vesicle coat complex AP-3, beta subunit [Phaffia rhodozyma]|uniref:Vesicle coat complex AP-3, beta subunit n=1 Tax=Phaffia rhodozyma TaxID=264483 RepID=A0A0F7SVZ4_PHARH|nr:Vesicle coat complex AP-3, beta subunit [Phaffia rhodozyma]
MDSLNRLSQRISENIQESARDLTFNGSSKDLYETNDDRTLEITKLLESSHEREKIMGMKRLIALISKGRPVSSFFPVVVKQVSSPSLELRKLVYIYILRHAELEPDLALLSINTFQKDLNDPNPLIRCMALRVLSGISVPMIGSVVTMAIRKGAGDTNPYVRKAAALAIPKLYETDASHHHTLLPIMQILLQERSPIAIGSILVAFQSLCPLQPELLHPHYRRLCGMLVEADEWGQVVMMNVLGRYARIMLEKPKNDQDDSDSEPDEDLLLLFQASLPLVHSTSPAVLLSLINLHHILSPSSPSPLPHLAPPLLRVLATTESEGTRIAILKTCQVLVKERKDMFEDDEPGEGKWKAFLGTGRDESRKAVILRIDILKELASSENVAELLEEFLHYERDTDDKISQAAIEAIGYCAQHTPEIREKATHHLLRLLKKKRESTITSSILVLKGLILSSPSSSSLDLVARLASRLDDIRNPKARACVVGLVGEHLGSDGRLGAEVLRIGVKGFIDESEEVKLALLTLSSKLLLLLSAPSALQNQVELLSSHLFSLARYDGSYDVRDRSRFLKSLVRGLTLAGKEAGTKQDEDQDDEGEGRGGVILRREQVALVLGGGRVAGSSVHEQDLSQNSEGSLTTNTEINTLSLLTQPQYLPSYQPTPSWQERGVDPSLREVVSWETSGVKPSFNGRATIQEGGGGGYGYGVEYDEDKGSKVVGMKAGLGAGGAKAMASAMAGGVREKGGQKEKEKKTTDLEKFYASQSESEETSSEEAESEDDEDENVVIGKEGMQVEEVIQVEGEMDESEYDNSDEDDASEDDDGSSSDEYSEDDSEDDRGESGGLIDRFGRI